MNTIPFMTIDWSSVEKTEHKGATGTSFWQTIQIGGLRVRIVDYSENYTADHWCQKGHIVYCLEGEFQSELQDANSITLKKGMMYLVSDQLSSHRSASANGTKLLIIDGNFYNEKAEDLIHTVCGQHLK